MLHILKIFEVNSEKIAEINDTLKALMSLNNSNNENPEVLNLVNDALELNSNDVELEEIVAEPKRPSAGI